MAHLRSKRESIRFQQWLARKGYKCTSRKQFSKNYLSAVKGDEELTYSQEPYANGWGSIGRGSEYIMREFMRDTGILVAKGCQPANFKLSCNVCGSSDVRLAAGEGEYGCGPGCGTGEYYGIGVLFCATCDVTEYTKEPKELRI